MVVIRPSDPDNNNNPPWISRLSRWTEEQRPLAAGAFDGGFVDLLQLCDITRKAGPKGFDKTAQRRIVFQ